tara:strand:+ start:952 stop:1416 length:465 start_codon:yes stop_codon:yes gene_type:complete
MSQVFTNKIKSARFIDTPTNSVIELLYSLEGDSILTQFHISVDFSDQTFLDFIKEWPLEKLEKDIAASAQAAKDISNEARKDWENETVEKLNPRKVLDVISKHNNDKALLFEYKLAILDEISGYSQSSKQSKSLQLKIRKCKNLKELLGIHYGV